MVADRHLPPIHEIVLTRPAGSNAGLHEALEAARPDGAPDPGPILTTLPLLLIRPFADGGELPAALAEMRPEDLVVFVSPRAVEAAAAIRPPADWPTRHVAAVGRATATALAAAGREDVVLPEGSEDSEGLLEALDGVSMAGRRVWIVRGETGRELLAESLEARGARPRFVAVYRRACPAPPRDLPAGADRLWIVTAPQALDCLATFAAPSTAGSDPGLLDSSLLVINERARDRARTLGFRGPIELAGGPGPEALARAVWTLVAARRT